MSKNIAGSYQKPPGKRMEKESKKLNCWEYKGCGRQPGGKKAGELGVCPAATDKKLDGLHGGKNAGRACWLVAGTMCGGKVQGSFAQKYGNCEKCDFFKAVMENERPAFKMYPIKKITGK
jgi:hypothetical protein